jgi:hypothetical protein
MVIIPERRMCPFRSGAELALHMDAQQGIWDTVEKAVDIK